VQVCCSVCCSVCCIVCVAVCVLQWVCCSVCVAVCVLHGSRQLNSASPDNMGLRERESTKLNVRISIGLKFPKSCLFFACTAKSHYLARVLTMWVERERAMCGWARQHEHVCEREKRRESARERERESGREGGREEERVSIKSKIK